MKKPIVILTLIAMLLAACAPAVTPTSQPNAAFTTQSAPATKKPKGKATQPALAATQSTKSGSGDQQSAPISANPNVIAPEILGRPTNNSITINVVPAQAMEIIAISSSEPFPSTTS